MKRWLSEHGFSERGAPYAEEALPYAIALVEALPVKAGLAFAHAVVCEAWYRKFDLTKRSAAFQKRYKKENGF